MLFKLSFENMKKSIKDYGIYFLTLVLGVAIFYMFNSLDSQEAMLQVSNSQRQMIQLMIEMLGMVSVFVAVVLGLLIVYANSFLINRRKKEFGIYMSLGMGRRQISRIILMETIFVGLISLVIGLMIGIFASQFMSILVSKLFEADMSKFEFVFSKTACGKTCIYFAVMYVAVMFFNTITISRYKLINLLNATKKNEKVKMKNPVLSILVFLGAAVLLGFAYWKVTVDSRSLTSGDKILRVIGMGIVGTILVFWSLSGFILQIVQAMKKTYLRDTNLFVLRQINNKINTMVVSMSVICLMLFMTITILSSALALRNTMQSDLLEMTPVDINLYKTANLPERATNRYGKETVYTEVQRQDSKVPICETLESNGLDMNRLKDIEEIAIYTDKNLTWERFFGDKIEEVRAQFPYLQYNTEEELIKVSDYNKIAKLYGNEEYELENDEYIMLCDFESQEEIRNKVLEEENYPLEIAGKTYYSKYRECKSGFVVMSTSHTNTGIILVPDDCNLTDEMKERYFFAANYHANTEEEKEEIEKIFSSNEENESTFLNELYEKGLQLDGLTKIAIMEASVGLATIITFISIYLGIIFLIASSAILALKQLTESSDNKQRYTILRKIGCDEKMIHRALFRQIGIFFGMPLILAVIHSVFGIQYALSVLSGIASKGDLLPSIIGTVVVMGVIYGAYFMATYWGSKNIIREEL